MGSDYCRHELQLLIRVTFDGRDNLVNRDFHVIPLFPNLAWVLLVVQVEVISFKIGYHFFLMELPLKKVTCPSPAPARIANSQ